MIDLKKTPAHSEQRYRKIELAEFVVFEQNRE
jgi:hypothetical protein